MLRRFHAYGGAELEMDAPHAKTALGATQWIRRTRLLFRVERESGKPKSLGSYRKRWRKTSPFPLLDDRATIGLVDDNVVSL